MSEKWNQVQCLLNGKSLTVWMTFFIPHSPLSSLRKQNPVTWSTSRSLFLHNLSWSIRPSASFLDSLFKIKSFAQKMSLKVGPWHIWEFFGCHSGSSLVMLFLHHHTVIAFLQSHSFIFKHASLWPLIAESAYSGGVLLVEMELA